MSHFHHISRHRSNHWKLWLGTFAACGFVYAGTLMTTAFAQNNSKDGSAVRVDEKGRKFVNKIPYDVFFDNPLQVVNDNKTVAPATEVPAEKMAETKPTAAQGAAAAKPAASGGVVWQELLPMEELQGEVKTIRNRLTASMTNQGQFNNNFKPIGYDSAELAALASIAQQHGESISWKDKAQYVRDFSAQLSQSAVGLGKENFDKTKSAFQKLTSVFDGSIPADAGDIPAARPFVEVAPRKALMKRIEKSKDWLKQDVNSEAKFKSMADQIQHEASILAALATVITNDSYSDAEADDYKEFAKTLIDGAKESVASSKDEDYEKFKQSVDKINKSCTDCHGTYGNK